MSSVRSLARLSIDIAVGLVYAIPAALVHATSLTFPSLSLDSLVSHFPFLQPYETLLNPTDTLTTLRTQHKPAIDISTRYMSVHNRLMVAEELCIAAVAEAAVTTYTVPSPPQRPVHLFLITGNPGTVHFYLHFLSHLHRLSSGALHIHSLSFAGHQSRATLERSVSSQPLYDLKEQTNIWAAYLIEWLERQKEADGGQPAVVLCGHSIGAWIALELMDRLGSDRILHSLLLFPTLSQMSRTPAGRRLRLTFAYGRPVLVPLAGLLAALVPAVLLRFVARYVVLASHPRTTNNRRVELEDTAATVVELFSSHVVAQCLYLAHSELTTVMDERPSHTQLMADGRATLVSGAADEWDPAWLQHDRRQRISGLREVRMEADVKHAFVVGSSKRVAEVVWQELQQVLQLGPTDETRHGPYRASTHRHMHKAPQAVV